MLEKILKVLNSKFKDKRSFWAAVAVGVVAAIAISNVATHIMSALGSYVDGLVG